MNNKIITKILGHKNAKKWDVCSLEPVSIAWRYILQSSKPLGSSIVPFVSRWKYEVLPTKYFGPFSSGKKSNLYNCRLCTKVKRRLKICQFAWLWCRSRTKFCRKNLHISPFLITSKFIDCHTHFSQNWIFHTLNSQLNILCQQSIWKMLSTQPPFLKFDFDFDRLMWQPRAAIIVAPQPHLILNKLENPYPLRCLRLAIFPLATCFNCFVLPSVPTLPPFHASALNHLIIIMKLFFWLQFNRHGRLYNIVRSG